MPHKSSSAYTLAQKHSGRGCTAVDARARPTTAWRLWHQPSIPVCCGRGAWHGPRRQRCRGLRPVCARALEGPPPHVYTMRGSACPARGGLREVGYWARRRARHSPRAGVQLALARGAGPLSTQEAPWALHSMPSQSCCVAVHSYTGRYLPDVGHVRRTWTTPAGRAPCPPPAVRRGG